MYWEVLDKQQDRKNCKEIRKSQFREIYKQLVVYIQEILDLDLWLYEVGYCL